MIVKKLPILQGFPGLETVKNLSNFTLETEEFFPLFYDIETTGLARNSTFLYLIGAVYRADSSWVFKQWFAEDPGEEAEILGEFKAVLKRATHTIQYNGSSFDQPYLEEKYRQYDMPSPFDGKPSLDLYRELKPYKGLLKLSGLKQPDLEAFLGLSARCHADGKDCIRLYREYIKTKDEGLAETILGHNQEDLMGLGRIFALLACRGLYQGAYTVTHCAYEDGHLILYLALAHPIPARFSNGGEGFYLTAEDREVRLRIAAEDGRLKRYYENYRDYDYLPLEDTAIPKVLSSSIDRSRKRPATKETCYTWFSINEAFLQDVRLQTEYIRHALPVWLGTLKKGS